MAAAHKVLKKSGSWYSWHRSDGTEIRGQGSEKFREALQAADGALEELYLQAQMGMRQAGGAEMVEEEPDVFDGLEGV